MPSPLLRRSLLLLALLLVGVPGLAELVPVGPPQRLSEHVVDCQMLAARNSGAYAVAWWEDKLGTRPDVVAATVVDDRDIAGSPHEIATVDSSFALLQEIRATPSGYTLDWRNGYEDDLHVRDLDLLGAPLGAGFDVPFPLEVSARPVGGFVATRHAHARLEIQLLDRRGAPVGRPSSIRDRHLIWWQVQHRADGAFVVIYLADDVFAQWFDANGRHAGKRFAIARPDAIAVGPDGTLAVVARTYDWATGEGLDVAVFDRRGRLRGATPLPTPAVDQAIAVDARGRVLVSWRDASFRTVWIRELDSRGKPTGEARAVNEIPNADVYELCPRVEAAGGSWVVSWLTADDANDRQLLVRRFSSP